MEIVNFLLIIFYLYMFIYTSILTKLFFVLASSLLVSFYRERGKFKNSNNYVLLTIYYIISFFRYIICGCLYLYEKSKDYIVFIIIKDGIKYLNYMFVSGRNDLFYYLSDTISNVFIPKNKNMMMLENKKKNVFDNDDDMMNFLDELKTKKKTN